MDMIISSVHFKLSVLEARPRWFGHLQRRHEEGSLMYWTKGVEDGAPREEETRESSEEVHGCRRTWSRLV